MLARAVTMLVLFSNVALAEVANRTLAADTLAAAADSSRVPATADSVTASAPDSIATPRARPDSIVAFPSPRVRAWQVGLVRGDRLEHASLSFALTASLIILTRNRPASAATALAFGVGKELWDRRTSFFDPVDLAADAVGVGLASLLVTPHGP